MRLQAILRSESFADIPEEEDHDAGERSAAGDIVEWLEGLYWQEYMRKIQVVSFEFTFCGYHMFILYLVIASAGEEAAQATDLAVHFPGLVSAQKEGWILWKRKHP